VGTVAFMAPEQITGEAVDARTDLYSLGAVLYVLLTLQQPITADSIAGYLARQLTETPPAPREIDPSIPRHLDRVCTRLLAKEPENRFSSAQGVLQGLDSDEEETRFELRGREEEMAILSEHLSALQAGAGGLVLLVGPAGIGKTSVLTQVASRAENAGWNAAHIRGPDGDPWRPLAGQIPGAELPAPGDATSTAVRVANRISGDPWVLLVDDLDQMPALGMEALVALVERRVMMEGEPLLIVASLAQTSTTPVEELCATLAPEIIPLGPVSRETLIAICRDQGLTGTTAAVLGNRVYSEFGGSPGNAVEQIQTLVEEEWLEPNSDGQLRAVGGVARLKSEPLPIPAGLLEREMERLIQVPTEARKVLNAAAVFGIEATVDLLAELAELDPSRCGLLCGELEELGLIVRRDEGMQELAEVSDARVQTLVVDKIETAERVRLHGRSADILARRVRRRSGPLARVIAEHLLAADRGDEAYPVLLQMARHELRKGDTDAAQALLNQAAGAEQRAFADLEPDDVSRCRKVLHGLEGELKHLQGDLLGSLEAWRRAIALSSEDDGDEDARIRAGMGLVLVDRGELSDARPWLEQAVQTLPRGEPVWPDAARALVLVWLAAGQISDADQLLSDLQGLGRETGVRAIHAGALAGLGLVALARGDMAGGRDSLENAEFRLRDAGRRPVFVRTLLRLAELLLGNGELDQANARALEALNVAREAGREAESGRALGLVGTARLAGGEEDDARRVAVQGANLIRDIEGSRSLASHLAAATLARLLCDLGDFKGAHSLLADLPTESREPGLDDSLGQARAVLARALAALEDDRAADLVNRVLKSPRAALPWPAIRTRLDTAWALYSMSDSRAPEHVGAIIADVRSLGFRLLELEAIDIVLKIDPDSSESDRRDTLRATLVAQQEDSEAFARRWP
jgi:tetratricopeptide (TPR) repeat protein